MKVNIKNKQRLFFVLGGIAIPIIHWLVTYVYVNASSIVMAFFDSHGRLSLDNFVRFFEEMQLSTSGLRVAFRNTLLTFSLLLITYPFKVLVSYFIYKKVPGASFYRIVFFLPTVLSSVCVSMVFKRLVGVNGIIAQLVGNWVNGGVVPELLASSRFANITVLLHMLWLQFPGDLIIWGGTFARIPKEVLESGYIDGTSWWTEFTKIIVPMVWPTVSLQMVLMFCGLFGASGSVFLLTAGQYDTMTISAWLYITLLASSGTKYTSHVYNYLAAVGILTTTVAVAISVIVRRITDRFFDEVEF